MRLDFALPGQAAEFVTRLARHLGTAGHEVAVVLGGQTFDGTTVLDRIMVPRQQAFRTEKGCGLLLDGGCLNRLGPRIRDEGRRICGILHSHPNEAYHSSTDDAAVLMRFHGAFSVVIPNFGLDDQLLRGSKSYVFDYKDGWQEVPSSELIRVGHSGPFEVIYDE